MNNFLDLNEGTQNSVIEMISASNEMHSTLLITGKTGTGKSLLASNVHRSSKRAGSGKWFKINLATLSENLIESELFGHERGAFTGADCRRLGKLEIANGGTVFLDEIGELPLRLQSKFLDFIQYKTITPVGSNREIALDVRIIAATNKDLEKEVEKGTFREDLYHRIKVFHVHLPDLKMNRAKILPMAAHILKKRNEISHKKIESLTEEVAAIFLDHNWPGNIREMENALEYAIAMESTTQIQKKSLPVYLKGIDIDAEKLKAVSSYRRKEGYLEIPFSCDFRESKAEFEKNYLEHALRAFNGQINLTSQKIKLNKVSMAGKIRKYQIDWKKIRRETLGPNLRERATH